MFTSIAHGLKALEVKFHDHWSFRQELFTTKRTDIGHSSILLLQSYQLLHGRCTLRRHCIGSICRPA